MCVPLASTQTHTHSYITLTHIVPAIIFAFVVALIFLYMTISLKALKAAHTHAQSLK